jgi:hypothetical protein
MVNMISTERQWHPQEQESQHMKPQAGGELGLHMGNMDGKSVVPWNITDVIRFISQKLEDIELWKKLNSPQQIHFTTSFSSRFGHSSRSRSHSRPIIPATSRPIL